MCTIHFLYLIERKCTLRNVSLLLPAPKKKKKETIFKIKKLHTYIEKNLINILNRIYECSRFILSKPRQSLQPCFMFKYREE